MTLEHVLRLYSLRFTRPSYKITAIVEELAGFLDKRVIKTNCRETLFVELADLAKLRGTKIVIVRNYIPSNVSNKHLKLVDLLLDYYNLNVNKGTHVYSIKGPNPVLVSVVFGIMHHVFSLPNKSIELLFDSPLQLILKFMAIVGPLGSPLKFKMVSRGTIVGFPDSGRIFIDWLREKRIPIEKVPVLPYTTGINDLGSKEIRELNYCQKEKYTMGIKIMEDLKEFIKTDFFNKMETTLTQRRLL